MSKSLVESGSASAPPAETASHSLQVLPPAAPFAGFFSFSYAVTEVSMQGDRTTVRARQTRFQDGRLTTETFEGALDGSAYADALQAAQQQAQAQWAWVQQALTWWLPLLPGLHRSRD